MGVKSKLTNDIAAIWTGPCLKLTILPIQTQRAKYMITVINAIMITNIVVLFLFFYFETELVGQGFVDYLAALFFV